MPAEIGGTWYYWGNPRVAAFHPTAAYAIIGFNLPQWDGDAGASAFVQALSIASGTATGGVASGLTYTYGVQQFYKKLGAKGKQAGLVAIPTDPSTQQQASLSVTAIAFAPVPGPASVNSFYAIAIQQDLSCYTTIGYINNALPGGEIHNTVPPPFAWGQDGLYRGGGLAWSPEGKMLAVACGDSQVRIFGKLAAAGGDVTGWSTQALKVFDTYAGLAYGAFFTPNAEYMAAPVAPAAIYVYGGCDVGTQMSGYAISSQCTPCAAGKAASVAGAVCTSCPSGYFNTGTGNSDCWPCGKGNTSALAAGSTSCAACPAGRFGPLAANAACQFCQPGLAQPSAGKTRCNLCASGTFSNVTGLTNCFACEFVYHAVMLSCCM